MTGIDTLAERFSFGEREFASSPLYGRLSAIIAADARLLEVAAHCRAGQQPTNLLFAAVQFLLLGEPRGARPELAEWYPSLGGDRSPGDERLPGVFTGFCLDRRAELTALLERRLVQTNVVKRSAVLRFGLSAIAPAVGSDPVSFLEVGASSGIHLAFDRYRVRIGSRWFGPQGSPVVIETGWRSGLRVPEGTVALADRLGVDLHPIDLTDPVERRWLRALVWPENRGQAQLLDSATELVAADPPRILTGDMAGALDALDARLPTGRPLVVWHAATRAHVLPERRPAFDAAVAALGRRRPLWTLSLESPEDLSAWHERYGLCYALQLRDDAGNLRRLAAAHGHGDWIEPIEWPEPDR